MGRFAVAPVALLAILGLLGLLGIAACAAPSGEVEPATETAEDALSPASLRARTALERAHILDGDGTVQVAYDPPDAERYTSETRPAARVRFEAVRLEPAATGPAPLEEPQLEPANGDPLGLPGGDDVEKTFLVAGDFPSAATVLITDEDFRVLARAKTSPAARGLGEAHLAVPLERHPRFVLVRDLQWVKPMSFDVRVGGPGR